jgi:hypothetical protein
MVYRKISRDLKECTIFLLDYPEICTDICGALGLSPASVKHWRRNIWDFGNVDGRPHLSRASRKHLNEEKIDQIVYLYYMTPSLLLDKVKESIQVTHNIPTSHAAIF